MTGYRAVIFDIGGVVVDSPLEVIAEFERRAGIPDGLINRVVAEGGAGAAWARHERGEIDRDRFVTEFRAELARRGIEVDVADLLDRIDGVMRPRPPVLAVIRRLRERGIKVAAITNNWRPFEGDSLVDEFDVFLESVVEGVRKPEPEIYRRCLALLGVAPSETVMLDDIGSNLKPAREMGMATIKVACVGQALADLSGLVGVDLS